MKRTRGPYLMLAGLAVLAGLVWRSRFLPLTPFLSKYGGDAIWAMVVFFGFGFLFPRLPVTRLFVISLGTCWAIEFSQLYHAPWIDSIRAMRMGHLVLGSTFNWPDLPAYAVGVGMAVLVDVMVSRAESQFRS